MVKKKKEETNVEITPRIDITEIEDIEEEINRQTTEVNDSKELFENKNIGTRTDLSDNEIVYSTKLKYIAGRFNLPVYNDILQNFMEYKLSRNRKSRKEYIESMKQKISNMMNGFGGFGGNNDLRR